MLIIVDVPYPHPDQLLPHIADVKYAWVKVRNNAKESPERWRMGGGLWTRFPLVMLASSKMTQAIPLYASRIESGKRLVGFKVSGNKKHPQLIPLYK